MDEHPGDTLGNRFLTFWGALGAILALAIVLAIFRWIAVPSAQDPGDAGAGNQRLATFSLVSQETTKEYNQAAEVEAGKTVRLPPDAVVPWAARILAGQPEAASAVKTPEALVREQEEKSRTTHDPNLSLFEGK